MARITQLRLYTINKGKMDEFVKLWRDAIVPARQKTGFTVEGGWIFDGESRFVWMVSAEGTMDEWKAKEQAYYTSPERQAMNPDPASFIAHMEIRFVNSALA